MYDNDSHLLVFENNSTSNTYYTFVSGNESFSSLDLFGFLLNNTTLLKMHVGQTFKELAGYGYGSRGDFSECASVSCVFGTKIEKNDEGEFVPSDKFLEGLRHCSAHSELYIFNEKTAFEVYFKLYVKPIFELHNKRINGNYAIEEYVSDTRTDWSIETIEQTELDLLKSQNIDSLEYNFSFGSDFFNDKPSCYLGFYSWILSLRKPVMLDLFGARKLELPNLPYDGDFHKSIIEGRCRLR